MSNRKPKPRLAPKPMPAAPTADPDEVNALRQQLSDELDKLLSSYQQHALGYLAVVRKANGALIGRCGLMDMVVKAATPGPGMRRGWFGRERAPADVGPLIYETELGYTLDPGAWGQGFASEAARCLLGV